ncbi:MAG: FAD-dependent thymidylate synthase, partial [Candidatus Margulisbacteria bacterium]|nr:FAD-dependent thymidylate synthase [Candidatus Margulisiibacteriota bacterium]
EEIEKFRLCAYTEKSQRYQKLGNDFVVPEEIKGSDLEKDFTATIKKQNDFYHELVENKIEPEDARYVTSLATEGQLGQTINARNLEFLFRRFASHPLFEVRQIGSEMYKLVEPIAPSIILFAGANEYDQKTFSELKAQNERFWTQPKKAKKAVELVEHSKDADNKTIAALLHTSTNLPYKKCLKQAKAMSEEEKKELIKTCFKYAELYDRPHREFEYVDLTFDLVVSAACFGQLKRHRMASITSQAYEPGLGVLIPEAIVKAGLDKKFNRVINITNKAFEKISGSFPLAAQYVLTNAHCKRVLVKVNGRELYHMSRLREDKHAQWDIQNITRQMTDLAKKVMPLTMLFIGGKDAYSAIYEANFGKKPKVLPEY